MITWASPGSVCHDCFGWEDYWQYKREKIWLLVEALAKQRRRYCCLIERSADGGPFFYLWVVPA